jgi:hypothetical protein
VDFSGLPNVRTQTFYIYTHLVEFKEIMTSITESHQKFEETKKLNIQTDPWDNYLYFDSKFLFDFIFNNSLKSSGSLYLTNSINALKSKSDPNVQNSISSSSSNSNDVLSNSYENAEEKFILLKFLLFIYHNNLASHFKIDGKVTAWKLIEYVKKIASDENEQDKENYLMKFTKNVLLKKLEPNQTQIDKFETKLETLFDLFIQDLTTKKLFSEVKEDYFKI